jgi:crotonobetainyl-CoA:carnitine CoA-transferase CaiB-like acyl-CoA transferase
MSNDTAASTLPLSRVHVLDLTLARAGPTCVRHLADWGADVIRIEPPAASGEEVVGRRNGPDFQNLHRNKRAIRLDLKSPEGHAAFMRLAERADVIVENMRTRVKHRLKISYDDVKQVNPRIVYGSVSGFGQDGPYSERAGVDQIAQGMGGLMTVTGLPGQGPVRVGIAMNDLVAGTSLAYGIMVALFERERTGVGRWVHTSLLETQIFMMDFQAARYLIKGEVAGQAGNDHPTMIPSGVFPTKDRPINVAAPASHQWERFCDAVGKSEWKDRPEWKTQVGRSRHREEINAAIAELTRTQPSAHWIALCEGIGIPCGAINTMDQVFEDPQVQHLRMAAPVQSPQLGELHLVASPLNMPGVPKTIRRATPEAGADTDEVLRSVGYSDEDIAGMRSKGVI